MAPALPQPQTTRHFFKLFSCGGPDMAPALPQAADDPSAGQGTVAVRPRYIDDRVGQPTRAASAAYLSSNGKT